MARTLTTVSIVVTEIFSAILSLLLRLRAFRTRLRMPKQP